MKDLKLFVAYALFSLCLIVVCLWSITQDYEYEGNREVVERVDTIVVYKNKKDYDWDAFTRALIWVESKGDSKAVGKLDDVGVLQIRPIIVEDCNRILGMESFKLEDRLDSLKSVEMFNIIQDHYNREHDLHFALKIWNPRSPISYHRKVMNKYTEIKNRNK